MWINTKTKESSNAEKEKYASFGRPVQTPQTVVLA